MSDEQVTVTCPCGSPMVQRTNRQNGSEFMGCTRYPDCNETARVPAWIHMKRTGALELPGLESDE